jgi:ribonuclease D
VQICAADRALIIDALATPLDPLAALLGDSGPIKIVHDVAFDARILAESGIELGNVHDTSIAARLVGRTATGLATLALAELGVTIDKQLQHHDWRERPLLPEHVDYLARDVAHLAALHDRLWSEVREKGVEAETLEETRYRVACAIAAVRETDREPAYLGARGFDKLAPVERAIFRRVWQVREDAAKELDVPPGRLISTDALLALARSRPRTKADLAKARLRIPDETQSQITDAVARGVEEGDIPEEDRAILARPKPSRDEVFRRRTREAGLSAWRRAEAKARGVDEQVVLPGHCLKALAEADGFEVGTIHAVAGFGACRARYLEAIATVLSRAEGEQNA